MKIKYLCLAMVLGALGGCNNNIEAVKNAHPGDMPEVTYQSLLENWKECSSFSWAEKKSDSEVLVTFTCRSASFPNLIRAAREQAHEFLKDAESYVQSTIRDGTHDAEADDTYEGALDLVAGTDVQFGSWVYTFVVKENDNIEFHGAILNAHWQGFTRFIDRAPFNREFSAARSNEFVFLPTEEYRKNRELMYLTVTQIMTEYMKAVGKES